MPVTQLRPYSTASRSLQATLRVVGINRLHEYQPVLEIKRTFDLPLNLNGNNAADAKPGQT